MVIARLGLENLIGQKTPMAEGMCFDGVCSCVTRNVARPRGMQWKRSQLREETELEVGVYARDWPTTEVRETAAAVRLFSREPPDERSSEVSRMSEHEVEEFARVVAKLIQTNAEVRQAVWDCACACPNLDLEL